VPAPPIDDGLRQKARDLYAEIGNRTEVGRRLRLDRNTVRKYTADMPAPPAAGRAAPSPSPAPAGPPETPEQRATRMRELSRERDLLRDVAGEKSFRSFLESLAAETVERLAPPPKPKPFRPHRGAVSETLVTQWSDWHWAEIVKSEAVQGLNNYNAAVGRARVWSIVDKLRNIKARMEKGGWHFPRAVVAVNGDLISGSIHEVEKHSDPNNVILAAYQCGRLLALALRDVAAEFPEVWVVCTPGNHGRLPDHRRVASKEPSRNWDTLIALIAKTACESIGHMRFIIPDSYTAVYEVEGHLFGQSHGHDVKSWMHTPIYGLNRMVSSLNAIRVTRGKPINYFLFGHFHNKVSVDYGGAEYFVNGSLIGGTEFSVNALGKADRPCQWMLGVHKEHGVTHRWPLYAEEENGTYEVPQ